ncbi:MAG: ABC transporter permease [Cycloclasticus sp. symbiont of Poecilosclerida sp. M]|nr:MAG: ABC transporter permease [Cycloclasticus sp. symbiont of Poecilosclerida sp. M]
MHTFFASLGCLARTPFNFMMTIGVIGITLSLPAGMLVAIDNFKSISGNIDLNHNISLYLKHHVTQEAAEHLSNTLKENPKISHVRLIDKQQALEEFREYSGFGAALNTLEKNPLPHLIQITPTDDNLSEEAIQSLRDELEQNSETQNVQIDMAWLKRLNALLNIAERTVSIIVLLLGIAVLLIVSNTIRLELQNRRDEIDVTRLVGATRAFIRRPFIYSGFWYGVFGGVLACLLVTLSIWLIDGPTSILSKLYGNSFQISYMPFLSILFWLVFAILLGVVGSWVVVSRHLSRLEQ